MFRRKNVYLNLNSHKIPLICFPKLIRLVRLTENNLLSMGQNKLIPYEAYPLVVFIAGIVAFAGFRCFKLAKNPDVRFRRDDQELPYGSEKKSN